MQNLSQALKAEIQRISRREIKTSFRPIRSSTVGLKKTVAELRRKVATLESENKRLLSFQKAEQEKLPQVSSEEAGKVRISSKSIHALRNKLGLSQDDFAKLIDVSGQAVYAMEHKEGRLRFRGNTLNKILAIKGIGKREAQKRLEEMEGNKKPTKKGAKPKIARKIAAKRKPKKSVGEKIPAAPRKRQARKKPIKAAPKQSKKGAQVQKTAAKPKPASKKKPVKSIGQAEQITSVPEQATAEAMSPKKT